MNSKLSRPKPINRQVEEYIRSLIISHEWLPGARVPSNQALAEATGTSVFTVQAALARLTKEGLIERKQKVGTFVKGGQIKLSCIGIYVMTNLWNTPDTAFYQILLAEFQLKMESLGIKTRVFVDDRSPKAHDKIYPALKLAIKNRDIQALIVPILDNATEAWISKIPITTAVMTGSSAFKNKTCLDEYMMVRTAVKELHAQKCKSVGIICLNKRGHIIQKPNGESINYYQHFAEEAEKLGMKVRSSWMLGTSSDEYIPHKQQYGYDQFQALWNQEEHPEGLFVFPDNTAMGVITGILARRVDVPKQLKIALHANDKIHYLCPMPATLLVTKIGDVVEALFEIIKAQNLGQAVNPIRYVPKVRYSKGELPV